MKHLTTVTKSMPAKAFSIDEHPAGLSSILGLIQDPIGVLTAHFQYIVGVIQDAILGDKAE